MKTEKIIAVVMLTLIATTLSANLVMADEVNMEINVNGSANLNITVDADDTEAREDIAEIEEDLYGEPHSDPEDYALTVVEETLDEGVISDICSNPTWQDIFNGVSSMPTDDFRNAMKALGYDDETHINTIWNICQHKYLQQQEDYIQSQESTWSSDTSGISSSEMIHYIEGAINWLMGSTQTPDAFKEIGSALSSYFASKAEVAALKNQYYNDIYALNIRLKALEYAMEDIASEEYCQGKLEVMMEYNLTGVKCGEHSTWYYNMEKKNNGQTGIIGITPIDGTTTTTIPKCVEDWKCTEWYECKEDIQLRICVDRNECGTEDIKPKEYQQCVVKETQTPQQIISGRLSGLVTTITALPFPDISFLNTPIFTIQLPTTTIPTFLGSPSLPSGQETPDTTSTTIDLNNMGLTSTTLDLLNLLAPFSS